jgi:hypothetical protein
MTDADKIERLVAQCKAYHSALDSAFAMLATVTRPREGEEITPFFPSKSPMWSTMVSGHALMRQLGESP